MSENGTADAQILAGRPSRIIEYFPPGPSISARDCVYAGRSYSKGAVVNQADGNYVCSGDKDGTWTAEKKK